MSKYLILCSLLLIACAPVESPTGPENKVSEAIENSDDASSPTQNEATLPDPEDIASFTGMSASACSEEGTLLSQKGAATSIVFKNSAASDIVIYWLDFSGKRVEYKKLSPGGSHTQQTFVTHPWLIANEKDQCLGIYTATSTSNVILDIKESVEVAGSDTGSIAAGSLSSLTQANVTEARVRQGISCLESNGFKTDAQTVQGLLNVYLQFKPTVGEVIAKKGYLEPTVAPLNSKGC